MAKRKASKRKSSTALQAILLWPLKVIVGLVLPFFLLLRGSVTLYELTEWNPYLCIGISAILSMVALYFYLTWIIGHVVQKKKNVEKAKRINLRVVLIAVGGFCIYAVLYLAAGNAKTTAVQDEYQTTHPLLRLGVSTFILFDRDLVVTDMARTHLDYREMGLAMKNKSLHYAQSDGYVHALDLRTNDRADWRNKLLETYFWFMGYRTLRHVGSADHLHISLMIKDNPGAL
jgi:hypothetical protein